MPPGIESVVCVRGSPSSLLPFLFLNAKVTEDQVSRVVYAVTVWYYLRPTCLSPVLLIPNTLYSNHKEGVILQIFSQFTIHGFNIAFSGSPWHLAVISLKAFIVQQFV